MKGEYLPDVDGNPVLNEDGTPVVVDTETPQLRDFYNEYKEAVGVLGNNALTDAEKYKQASEFAKKADEELTSAENVVKHLKEAIKDTKAAEEAAKAAQAKVDQIKTMSEQYTMFMTHYFRDGKILGT
ncbi:MAG: hypothetical protein K6E49_05590 [Lachnospiraceae bacterium]|nr:hypothetical protein [Lachnospiraceae bacterium]